MFQRIINPKDYCVALYIRLSKEDENEGPSQSVTNQKSLLNEFVQYTAYLFMIPTSMTAGVAPVSTALTSSA